MTTSPRDRAIQLVTAYLDALHQPLPDHRATPQYREFLALIGETGSQSGYAMAVLVEMTQFVGGGIVALTKERGGSDGDAMKAWQQVAMEWARRESAEGDDATGDRDLP